MIIDATDDGGYPYLVADIGCGDLAWMRQALPPDIAYVGYDACEWPSWQELRPQGWELVKRDVVAEGLTDLNDDEVKLLIARDVMIHLPNVMILKLLADFRNKAEWLLATTFLDGLGGRAVSNGERLTAPSRSFSRLDLRLPPFSLGNPVLLVPETHEGKFLGLWRIRQDDEI